MDNNEIREMLFPPSLQMQNIEKLCWIKTEVKKANVNRRKELDDAVFRSRLRRAQIRALYCLCPRQQPPLLYHVANPKRILTVTLIRLCYFHYKYIFVQLYPSPVGEGGF